MSESKRQGKSTGRARGRKGSNATRRADRRMRSLLIGLGVLLVVGMIGTWVVENRGGPAAVAEQLEGLQTFPDEGRQHVQVGQVVQYRTDPPTSGAHYPAPVVPGFYDVRLPDEALVHNLEHGHILVWYDEERATEEDLAKVRDWTQRYTHVWGAVVAVPRPNLDTPFVLTAWTHMLNLDFFDEEKMTIFTDAFRGRGPENPIR